jgi:molybdenum cofactor guanylyltransferase
MDSFEGFILAGGASSRMGTDKSKLILEGATFVARIAAALSAITSAVTVVGKNVGNESVGNQTNPKSSVRTVPDVFAAWGALGGLHAALSACGAVWAIVVACDLPFVSADLFTRLIHLREDFAAVAPVQSDGWAQPLCALYRVNPCLAMSEKLIKSGERRPVTLLQSVSTRWVSFAEVEDLAGADRFFANMNTPEDYARALASK